MVRIFVGHYTMEKTNQFNNCFLTKIGALPPDCNPSRNQSDSEDGALLAVVNLIHRTPKAKLKY